MPIYNPPKKPLGPKETLPPWLCVSEESLTLIWVNVLTLNLRDVRILSLTFSLPQVQEFRGHGLWFRGVENAQSEG